MAVNTSTDYNIINKATSRSLNVYAGDCSANSNVVQWETDFSDNDQIWRLSSQGSSQYYLKAKCNSLYCLDAYLPNSSGGNADVWAVGADPNAQKISLESVSGDSYRIKLNHYNLYLTAIGSSNGTLTGYYSTSAGNVYWLPKNNQDTQIWTFVDASSGSSSSTGPSTGKHNLTVGANYTITSSSSGKNLNLYGGDCSSSSNVVQWTADPDDLDQVWTLKSGSKSGTNMFEIFDHSGYVLDAYSVKTSGANADVWPIGDYDAQNLSIVRISGTKHTISLSSSKYSNLYLTAVGNANGSKTGYGSTSDGNVYWAPYKGTTDQYWEINKVSITENPTTGNHTLSLDTTYMITSCSSGRNVNLYGSDTSANSNVVQWEADTTDRDQMWKLKSGTVSGTNQFETFVAAGYVLDAYSPKSSGANADVWQNNDPDAQNLVIRKVSGTRHTISLRAFPNLYLTAIGNANGAKSGYSATSEGNIYWSPRVSNSNTQLWDINRVVAPEYPTTSNHSLTVGTTYALTNVASGKNMNLYGGDYSKNSNVCQWTADASDTDQMWVLLNGNTSLTYYLETVNKSGYFLDAYAPKTSGANADVWAMGDVPAQDLVIRRTTGNRHTVSLRHFPNLFLTAIGTDNGTKSGYGPTASGNVYWSEMNGSTAQEWIFTKVESIYANPDVQNFKIISAGNGQFNLVLASNENLLLSSRDSGNGASITLQTRGAFGYEQKWCFFDYQRNLSPNHSVDEGNGNGNEVGGGSDGGETPTGNKKTLEVYTRDIIIEEESASSGSYAAVNPNDVGALSIGLIQWHATRAYNLLLDIKALGGDVSILPVTIRNELNQNNPSLYETRTLTSAEATAVSAFISTAEGKAAQNNLIEKDVTSYINIFKRMGVQYGDSLAFLSDYYNQSPTGATSLANSAAGNYSIHNLYNLSSKAARRTSQYKRILSTYATQCSYGNASPSDNSGSGNDGGGNSGGVNIFKRETVPSTATGRIYVNGFGGDDNNRPFHKGSGLVEGSFYTDNSGDAIKAEITRFHEHVFKDVPEGTEKILVNLFGDWTYLESGYHQGIDINYKNTEETPIFSAHSGTIVDIRKDYYGQVCIKDNSTNIYYIYAHMKINQYWIKRFEDEGNVPITANDTHHLGIQAGIDKSGNDTFPKHLHFEVRHNGTVMNSYLKDWDANSTMYSLNPYGYLCKFI